MKEIELIKYPDGQINTQVNIFGKQIKHRINSYEDLFYLASVRDVQKYNKEPDLGLFIPCFFGQRSDRRFSENESFGLKIIADFINSLNFSLVEIFDPHSDVVMALVNNSYKISSFNFVRRAVGDIRTKHENDIVLVSPDAGAYKKIFTYSEMLELPLVAANKFRDLGGKVTLNVLGDVKDKICLIVDDLLDGGYTFHILGEKLKEQGASKVFLYISHAYFKSGYNFTTNIDHFYCTNSVKDIGEIYIDSYGNQHTINNVTQFKIV